MELKDWLVIFIPILFNGVLLFIFQDLYSTKINKLKRTNTYKFDVLKEFLNLLQKFYTAHRNFTKIDSSKSGKNYQFYELWNPIADSINELEIFADNHPIAIDKTNLCFNKCSEKYNEMVRVLQIDSEVNNYQITKEGFDLFVQKYNELSAIIRICMEKCEKEILDIV